MLFTLLISKFFFQGMQVVCITELVACYHIEVSLLLNLTRNCSPSIFNMTSCAVLRIPYLVSIH